MRNGTVLYIIHGLSIESYTKVGEKTASLYIIENIITGETKTLAEKTINTNFNTSKLIVLQELEELLLRALEKTRKDLRKSKNKYFTTPTLEKFMEFIKQVPIQEVEKELVNTNITDVHNEDKLSDIKPLKK